MRRPGKCHSFYAVAVLSSLFLACLITNRHVPTQEKPLDGARPQNVAVMPLLSTRLNAAEAHKQDRLRIEAGYGNLPLAFEPNRGQTDSRVKFLSHAGHHTLLAYE